MVGKVPIFGNSLATYPTSCPVLKTNGSGDRLVEFNKTDGNLFRYQHLGKAGSPAYLDTLEQITRCAKIEALDRAIEALNQGLKDLIEETSQYRQQ